MGRRSKRKGDLRDSYRPELDYGRPTRSRVFTVTTFLPRSVANIARREIYPYPIPKQIQKRGRVIRLSLRPTRGRYVKTKVRIRVPLHLPLVRGSMVSLDRNRINIHSHYQLRRALDAQELNRRRYSEYKRNKRKASHGQIDSGGSQRFGAVAHAYRRGASIDQIADAALVARALSRR